MPQELGLETQAVLYDVEQHPDHVVAIGPGGDEVEALFDLWRRAVWSRRKSGCDRARC